jgi:hypothetical protein
VTSEPNEEASETEASETPVALPEQPAPLPDEPAQVTEAEVETPAQLTEAPIAEEPTSQEPTAEEPPAEEPTEDGLPAEPAAEEPIPAQQAWWMLSLFTPNAADQVDWTRGKYALVVRSGRIESAARHGDLKTPANMIQEGSVLVSDTEPRGGARNVAPESFPHPVYRAGFAVAIPIPLRVTP